MQISNVSSALRRLAFLGYVVTFALALALSAMGCAASTSSDGAEHSSEALAPGGGGSTLGYTCGTDEGGTVSYCTCTGDIDCNDMYSDGCCANNGVCQINPAGVARCRCTEVGQKAAPKPPVHGGVIAPIGGLTRAH